MKDKILNTVVGVLTILIVLLSCNLLFMIKDYLIPAAMVVVGLIFACYIGEPILCLIKDFIKERKDAKDRR